MERLLLVDDDEFLSIVTKDVLEKVGYQVETAEDGELAWTKLNTHPGHFDLLLLDKNMPKLDGFSLLKRIKADNRFNNLPVIMLTGASQQEDVAEGLACGAYYYLIKPSPEKVLQRVVNNALEEQRNRRELVSQVGKQTEAIRIMHRAEFCFQTLQEAKSLALWLANVSGEPERTVTAYLELLINAVEHGNLGITYDEKSQLLKDGLWADEIELRFQQPPYSDRYVTVSMEKTITDCVVTIKDQGNGFDWSNYLDFSPERMFDLHGRGIAMSRLCGFDAIEYVGKGNVVVTTVKTSVLNSPK
jgi:DNA-binding response OmpR family regulator